MFIFGLMKLKNLHLIISSVIVISVAFIYGFQPNLLFDVTINSTDEANIFKAIMGLYLAFASLWIVAIFKNGYWEIATISNIIFMLGLGLGRIVSLILDGKPSTIFVIGLVGELILGFYALYQINNLKRAHH